MSYLLRLFGFIEAIFVVILGVVFYLAIQSGDLMVIMLSLALMTVLIAYSTLRRQRVHGF